MRKDYKNLDLEMLSACTVGKHPHPILTQSIILKQSISLPKGTHVIFATSIVKPSMAWTAICLRGTEMSNKLIVLFYVGFLQEGRLDELASLYLTKLSEGGFLCSLCSKISRDLHAGKSHLDSKHFPSETGHSCDLCGKHCKTKNALACHTSIYHRKK